MVHGPSFIVRHLLTFPIEWSGNCTTSTFDAAAIPASVAGASQLNIPAWALVLPSGTTWSPSDAQIAAESATPSLTSTTASPTSTGTSATGATTTSNPFGSTRRSTSNGGFASYTFSNGALNGNGGDFDGLGATAKNAGSAVGIAFGVILGFWALSGIIVGLIYWQRQKSRQAWYGPMARYYQDRGFGSGSGGPQTMYGE
jgi:hypothetical protein